MVADASDVILMHNIVNIRKVLLFIRSLLFLFFSLQPFCQNTTKFFLNQAIQGCSNSLNCHLFCLAQAVPKRMDVSKRLDRTRWMNISKRMSFLPN